MLHLIVCSKVRAWLNWQKISGNSSVSNYEQQIEILSSLTPSSNKARLLIEIADYAKTIAQKNKYSQLSSYHSQFN